MKFVGEKMNSKNSLISKQNHIREEIKENGEIQYNCTACRKVFRSRSQRYYHIKCTQLQDLLFKCNFCDKSFARQTQWKYHIESHISPVNKCPNCQKVFSNPLALKKHVALHEVKPKLCPHCDKTFKKKTSLDQHIAAQHLNKLQYGCAYCSKKYSSKSALQLHLQTHAKRRFECSLCGKLFQRNSILNLHLKRHYNMNSYICTICQKSFSESGTLARHRKVHEESVLQYYCKLCDKTMLRKDNMIRHLNTIHLEEKFDEIVEIIKSPITLQKKLTIVENEVCHLRKSTQDEAIKTEKSFLIIENKLLHSTFQVEESEHPNNNVESPLINQIKVITTVQNCQKEMHTLYKENISHVFEKQVKIAKHHHKEEDCKVESQDPSDNISFETAENCDSMKVKNKVAEQMCINLDLCGALKQTQEQMSGKKLSKNGEDYELNTIGQEQSVENESSLTHTFSSVIRTVGNVKKNLTSNTVTPTKSINHRPLEYKHKKYCRNNYNIDLYRKILGCDADNENIEKQEKSDDILKSSTPVHWRKCFKYNYETTGS